MSKQESSKQLELLDQISVAFTIILAALAVVVYALAMLQWSLGVIE